MRFWNSPGTRRLILLVAVAAVFAGARQVSRVHGRRSGGAGGAPAAAIAVPVERPRPAAAAELTWDVAPTLPRDLFTPVPVPRSTHPRAPRLDAPRLEPAAPHSTRVPQVQILLLDPRGPVAVVDGRRVAAGDTVSGCRVLAIDERGVTFERRGERLTARP